MMIFLFSQSRAVLIALEALTFLFMMTRIYDGASPLGVLLVFVIGSIIAVLISGFYAGMLHHRLLLLLYAALSPDDFIRVYEPLLHSKWMPSNVRFTLTAYLSNGCAAKGDFTRARALLDDAPQTGKRQQQNRELILCGNRISIALAEGAVREAESQLARMAQLTAEGRMDAKTRASQERILASLSAQLCILKGECHMSDCDILRDESKKPGSALRKAELNYFIGRAYALLNQLAFAREYLSAAAKADRLHYGKLAANALKALKDAPAARQK